MKASARLKNVTASPIKKKENVKKQSVKKIEEKVDEYQVDLKGAESIKQSMDNIPKNKDDTSIKLPRVNQDQDQATQKRQLAGTTMESPASRQEDRLEEKRSVVSKNQAQSEMNVAQITTAHDKKENNSASKFAVNNLNKMRSYISPEKKMRVQRQITAAVESQRKARAKSMIEREQMLKDDESYAKMID